jgi:hypothetical protein
MPRWRLVYQDDNLPLSVSREDGNTDGPPSGLVRYFEIAHGAWTMLPATRPIARGAVDWPQSCPRTGCPGSLEYVEHLSFPAFMVETGETIYPHGWKCDTCGLETGGAGGGGYAFTI